MLKFCSRECEYKRKTASIKQSRQLNVSRYSNHLKMSERLYDRFFLLLRRPWGLAVLILWQIIVLPLDDPTLPLRFRDIQVRHMEAVLLLHPRLNLLIRSLTLGGGQIQLIHINLNADMMLCLRKFGQKKYRLDVQRQ